MKKYELAALLQGSINEIVETDTRLAEGLFRLIDRLRKSQGRAEFPKLPCFSAHEFSQRERVAVLMSVLDQLASVYEDSISPKQMSYVNDLLDKISVGYFEDSKSDSSFVEELRIRNYKISDPDAEFALQVRISNLLEETMPNGAWIVE